MNTVHKAEVLSANSKHENSLYLALGMAFFFLIPSYYVAYRTNAMALWVGFFSTLFYILSLCIAIVVFKNKKEADLNISKIVCPLELGLNTMLLIFFLFTFIFIIANCWQRFIIPVSIKDPWFGIIVLLIYAAIDAAMFMKIKLDCLKQPSRVMEDQKYIFLIKLLNNAVILLALAICLYGKSWEYSVYVDPIASLILSCIVLKKVFSLGLEIKADFYLWKKPS